MATLSTETSDIKKCMSCMHRYAKYQATSFRGKKKSYAFCEKCKKLHTYSPDFPGEYMNYTEPELTPVSDACSTKTSSGSSTSFYCTAQCASCEFYYFVKQIVDFQFECCDESHQYKFCLNCAHLHRFCPHDFSAATFESMKRFHEVLRAHAEPRDN